VTGPVVPARLAFAADGTPFSEAYGDVYHSAAGGPGQARHVFLAGNGLPARWRGRRVFTILETGFGFGLGFLCTWLAWRSDSSRCERLHFVSVEKHPFARADLRILLERYPELSREAAQLEASWPMLVPGMHRIELEGGRVVLSLLFSDVRAVRDLRLAADAVFLDGFAPHANPDMWSPELMKAIARRGAPGATAATWSAAAAVRAALQSSGWKVEKRRGFGTKREMLAATLIRTARESPPGRERKALVVGGGIAGASAAERLCARGWEVTLLERSARPAGAGRHAGVFHPVLTPDDSLFARLTRAGLLAALARWRALEARGHAPVWDQCGVLQLARDEREAAAQRAALAALAPPPEYAQAATREEASAHAGLPVAAPGLWFPTSGWVKPLALVGAQLAAAGEGLATRFETEVLKIEGRDGQWTACGANGHTLARAPVLVLANAAEALRLAPQRAIRIRRVRGQITFLPAERFGAPRVAVLRGGYMLPVIAGGPRAESIAGATYDFDDEDPAPRASSHAGNLARLERIVPGAAAGLDPAQLEGVVGFRAVAPDRLPLIGALAQEGEGEGKNARLDSLARVPGLYGAFAFGSRGLLWAALGAELLASQLEGEPLPLEGRLVDALDPARFRLRALRRSA
jgi:tRNA 5-methylaminomethyl-2-thiouridine biosynthesis bifunctional protein